MLSELGAVVVDADLLAREVVEPGTPGLAAVVAEFGDGVLADDGTLDRPALGAVVFGDQAARRRLEAILHPLIRARGAAIEAEAGADALVVHDIPLLVETGQAGSFDAVVVVDVPVETQVERMVGDRGMSEADARATGRGAGEPRGRGWRRRPTWWTTPGRAKTSVTGSRRSSRSWSRRARPETERAHLQRSTCPARAVEPVERSRRRGPGRPGCGASAGPRARAGAPARPRCRAWRRCRRACADARRRARSATG